MTEKKNKRSGISKIALTNFQVFAERTEIPIEKITLMFGPNSAGKSAVEDALEIVRMIRESDVLSGEKSISRIHPASGKSIVSDIGKENNLFMLKLKSCWRKSGAPARYSQIMTIEIEETVDTDDGAAFLKDFNNNYVETYLIKECFSLFIHNDEFLGTLENDVDIMLFYSLDVDNSNVLSYNERSGSATLNCNHQLIRPMDFSSYLLDDECNINILNEDGIKYVDGFIAAFFSDNLIISFYFIRGFTLQGYSDDGFRQDSGCLFSDAETFIKNKDTYQQAFKIFRNKFNEILNGIWEHRRHFCGYSSLPVVIKASRKTPTKKDLFLCFKTLDSDDMLWREPSFLVEIKIDTSPDNNYISYIADDNVLKRVNYFLETQLFIENGYYIGSNSEYIEKDFEYRLDKNEPIEHQKGRLTFTQFYLADPVGTQFSFDEVGSGLGYVFPVLCTLAQNINQLVLIQQPELHLHPSLQAAMGDVIIESADNKTLIIETHSEHLLLRILKRIRQTHLQAAIAPELKINADDVCVLYFNPSPDGTTSVKRLRITEDGEFMDRWPRGFFGERDQELSDE